jgi:hypothetical protein
MIILSSITVVTPLISDPGYHRAIIGLNESMCKNQWEFMYNEIGKKRMVLEVNTTNPLILRA